MDKLNPYKNFDRDVSLLHSSVFKEYFDSMFNYGLKMTRNEDLVKDCIQELFFRMWKNNIDFASVANLKPYLLKGLRRQILNILELKYNQMDRIKVEENISIEFSPEDYYIQNQVEEQLRNKVLLALNNLSKKQREAIYLRFFEDLGYVEIAEIMNINLQSAKNNVQRGLDSLRDVLSAFLLLYFLRMVLK